jgi:hypothetical protein
MLHPFLYVFLYLGGGSLRPGYSQIADSVSELLSPGAPNKSILTTIQIVYALLLVPFGAGVLQFIRRSEQSALVGVIGAAMIIAIGLVTVGTAVFPQDATGVPPTTAGQLHKVLVFGGLIPLSILSTLLVGIWFRQAGVFPGFGTYSFISVGLIILSGMAAGPTMGTPIMGLVERLSALAVHQWLFVLALKLYVR